MEEGTIEAFGHQGGTTDTPLSTDELAERCVQAYRKLQNAEEDERRAKSARELGEESRRELLRQDPANFVDPRQIQHHAENRAAVDRLREKHQVARQALAAANGAAASAYDALVKEYARRHAAAEIAR